ncbi:M55 family metallopeptidase [Celerinatantimonas sp. MCCC 1A17872]|uniref:M55 family metallopeptidase n=1 Tax=Celerinatantimonas sp. MCCC 1A17872 TaxID=3177514 RepID=UPI0038BEB5B1
MKIFISADIEGIAGVVSPQQCSQGNGEYELARALMEEEVNAAIDGAFAGGASEVVVADSHGSMTNLRPAFMDERARLVQSKPRPLSMVEGIENSHYDGLFCIGYHSGVGQKGILAHTINGRSFFNVRINSQAMAEVDIYAAAACEYQTPLWLVSGDNLFGKWVEQYYPSAKYACVKRVISTTAAESLSPKAAQKLIRQQAELAVQQASSMPTTRIYAPYKLELTAAKPVLADIFSLIPNVEQLDARTVTYTGSTMREIISLLSAFSYLASTQG